MMDMKDEISKTAVRRLVNANVLTRNMFQNGRITFEEMGRRFTNDLIRINRDVHISRKAP